MKNWQVRLTKSRMVFRSRTVQLAWDRTDKALAFVGIFPPGRTGNRTGFTFGPGAPLWRVELRDKAGYPTLLDGTARAGFTFQAGRMLTLRWSRLAEGAVDVVLRVSADADRPLTRWQMEIVNRHPGLTVWAIHFPVLPDVLGPSRSHRKDILIKPEGFGCAVPDPIRQPNDSVWKGLTYPDGIQTMAFLALLNGGQGFYLGSHDPEIAGREFVVDRDKPRDRLGMRIGIVPPESGRCQRRVRLGYDTVLGLFKGDWYDAAQIYRPWAMRLRQARRTVAERSDIPEWTRHIPLWVQCGLANQPEVKPEELEQKAAALVALRKALGCEIATHLYSWHRNPFDISYPSYRPRPGIRRFVRQVQSGGVHVMPYINGRLFDPDNPDWRREDARRWAVKLAGAKLHPQSEQLQMEDYGSHAMFAAMCPATRYWQNKIAGVVAGIVSGLGVNGVYIDQIAAAGPAPCADPRHGHPLRNGGWWVRGYERMLAETRRRLAATGRKILLTTECNAEAYLGCLGTFLMWHSLRNFVVPLFPAVYGGRALLWGRSAALADKRAFRLAAAQDILWGCQAGWFGVDDAKLLLTQPYRAELDFIRRLCRLYAELQPFLHGGRMLRPPQLEGELAQAKVTWKFNGEWPETLPLVQAARWQLDAAVVTAVVNTHSRSQQVRIAPAELASAAKTPAQWIGGVEGRLAWRRGVAVATLPPGAILLLRRGRK